MYVLVHNIFIIFFLDFWLPVVFLLFNVYILFFI